MKIVLALGNPGSRYAATRHNIGWIVADALVERHGGGYRPGRGDYYQASIALDGHETLVVKPTTYMNHSGQAAAQVLEHTGTAPAAMLVLVDEIQFPLGRVQLKPSGSAGGHNGTQSVIDHLDTAMFPRLRCGIGDNFGPGEMVDYVLSPFAKDEAPQTARMVADAADAVETWIREGTARAMNIVNSRRDDPADGGEQGIAAGPDTAKPDTAKPDTSE